MLYVMVLLYILNGQVVFEKATFPTEAACVEAGSKRIETQMLESKFESGLFASCIELPAEKV